MENLNLERWRDHTPGLMGARAVYAVLVPLLYAAENEPALLFEVRAKTLRRQPGEVCFPGGKLEPGETPVQCALRELHEELGIPAERVEVVGQLDFIAHPSGFLLYPVLGKLQQADVEKLTISPAEVAETFQIPLSFFVDHRPEVWSYPLKPQIPADFPYERLGIDRNYPWRGAVMDVPVYWCEGRAVWGMTARIVRSLLEDES